MEDCGWARQLVRWQGLDIVATVPPNKGIYGRACECILLQSGFCCSLPVVKLKLGLDLT
jgi:hypothetical protein